MHSTTPTARFNSNGILTNPNANADWIINREVERGNEFSANETGGTDVVGVLTSNQWPRPLMRTTLVPVASATREVDEKSGCLRRTSDS